jgi:hypothetical protein
MTRPTEAEITWQLERMDLIDGREPTREEACAALIAVADAPTKVSVLTAPTAQD